MTKVGEWPEKMVTSEGEVSDSDERFKEMKERFLRHEKETSGWVLTSVNPDKQHANYADHYR